MLEKAVLMEVASEVMAAVAPSAMIAATSAYSMRSWPDSSRNSEDKMVLAEVMMILLKMSGRHNYVVSGEIIGATRNVVNGTLLTVQRMILT
jgi:hypothetical protein